MPIVCLPFSRCQADTGNVSSSCLRARLSIKLDRRLGESEWLADDYSIADIANWCWVRTCKWSGVSRDGLAHLDRWLDVMKEMPGLRRGVEVPFSVESLLEGEQAAQDFNKNARKTLQT